MPRSRYGRARAWCARAGDISGKPRIAIMAFESMEAAAAAFAIGVLLFVVAYTLFMFAYMHLENYTCRSRKFDPAGLAR